MPPPNLTGIMAESHMAGRVGYGQTAGLAAGGSTPIADMSAARGDKLISVLAIKGNNYISMTAGFAGDASSPVGGAQLSGGISAARGDTVQNVFLFGTTGATIFEVTAASIAVSNNRVVITDTTGANRKMQTFWSVGGFAGRNIPSTSATIVATRLKISDIATNGHKLLATWWKGDRP